MLSPLVIYLIIMIGGAAFLMILFLMGGFGDTSFEGGDMGGDMGHDFGGHDGGHAEIGHAEMGGSEAVSLSPMSPTLIALAITSFGAFGIIFTVSLSTWSTWLIGIISVISAIICAGLIFYALLQFLAKAQSSSLYRTVDMVGKHAEVTVKIPKGGTGVIDYETKGQRATASAKSDEDISQGETVHIVKVVGNIFYVEKMEKTDSKSENKDIKLPTDDEVV